jgi:XTP/dITP diphosphohydrolase
MATLEIVLATRNSGKVEEMKALLADLPVTFFTVADYPDAPDVEEDAPTLQGNAAKKARALHAHTALAALADDTGLEVAALDGRPGVHSARYAGPEANDAPNRALLRKELSGHTDRTAQFRTVIAFMENGQLRTFEGICKGHIIDEERGSGGFGYDALFVPEGATQTFAEMDAAAKNAMSHRGRALRAFAAYLQDRL